MILIATVIVIVILLIVLLFTEHFEEISNISSSSLNNLIDAYNDNKLKANTLSISDSINSKNIISNSISSETINSSNIISKSLNTDTLKTSSIESTDLKCNTINGLDIINGLTIPFTPSIFSIITSVSFGIISFSSDLADQTSPFTLI